MVKGSLKIKNFINAKLKWSSVTEFINGNELYQDKTLL